MKDRVSLTTKPEGLYCPQGDFFIDPVKPVERAVISHGHADHARAGHTHVLASQHTLDIMTIRYGENHAQNTQALKMSDRLNHNGVKISLAPAGHILGSAQIIVEQADHKTVFSGDYKRGSDPTCEDFQLETCDVFITEATFGLPVFRHPYPKSEILKLLNSLSQEPDRPHLVGVYALGKAQRVIRLLRDAGYEEPIFIHGALRALCDYYARQEIKLGELVWVNDEKTVKDFDGKIVLGPPSSFASRWGLRFKNPKICFVSGWMMIRQRAKQAGVHLPIVISDHCDWPELQQTIKETGAEKILVTHGREDALIRWCEIEGIDASALRLLGYEDMPEE